MYFNLEDTLKHCSVLGGELCMWTELTNEHNLMTKIWSRAAAFAERLWSGKEAKSVAALVERLVFFE